MSDEWNRFSHLFDDGEEVISEPAKRHRARGLMDEPPMLVYPTLAALIGINEAVILQQVQFLINGQRTAKNKYNYVNGRWWVYNSYKDWKEEYFPWLSEVTIRRILTQHEKNGYLVSMQSVKHKSDRRKWYSFDPEKWDEYLQTMRSKRSHQPSDQKDRKVRSKRSHGYSETSSETSKNTANAGVPEINTTDTPQQTTFDDIPGYMESRAQHGAVYNRQHAYKERIAEVWNWPVGSTQNTHREQQLRGVATKGEWKECNLPLEYVKRLDPDDLPHWKVWELSRGVQSDDKILVSRAAPVQASIMAYIDAGKPRITGNGSHAPDKPMVKVSDLYSELEGVS